MDAQMQPGIDSAAESQYEHSMARCPYGDDEERREYARQLARRCMAYADREPEAVPEPAPPAEEPPAPPVPTPDPEPEPEVASDPEPEDDEDPEV